MCLMVWIGTARALETIPRPHSPDPDVGYACIEAVANDAPVRDKFNSPHVAYVGSHEGCGCGYQSGGMAFQGVASVADARALSPAMADDERVEFEAEQRSRERLRALVESERTWGTVELYACWAGAEKEPPAAVRDIDSTWLTEQLEPFAEEVKYVIAARARPHLQLVVDRSP